MLHFICELILSCVVAGPGAKPVDELTYGNVLYSYYQQDHQQALLDTMVAEGQGRRGTNPARFELAKVLWHRGHPSRRVRPDER